MNKLKFYFTIFIIVSSLSLQAQKKFKILNLQLNTIVDSFHGKMGIYIHHLITNKVIAINEDSIFPTASTVKVPILLCIMNKIDKKELSYHQELEYKDSLYYAGVDILASFKNNEKIELSKVIMLMLTTSDNTASLWLQSIAGKGDSINMFLAANGFINTRVNSRTKGREEARNEFGWGQTTPKEMAQIFEKIYKGEYISRKASNKMIQLLGRNYWDEEGLSEIPSGVFVASKNGAVNASRSEVMLVMGKNGPFIISIYTKNNKDISWEENNEAWLNTKKIVRMVYNYFEKK